MLSMKRVADIRFVTFADGSDAVASCVGTYCRESAVTLFCPFPSYTLTLHCDGDTVTVRRFGTDAYTLCLCEGQTSEVTLPDGTVTVKTDKLQVRESENEFRLHAAYVFGGVPMKIFLRADLRQQEQS